jgi:hypothetical protein
VSLLGKDWGAVARPNISRGTLILSEKPLLKVPSPVQDAERVQNMVVQSLCALDKEQQRRFLELSNNFLQLHIFIGTVKVGGILFGVAPEKGASSLSSLVSTIAASSMQFIHGMGNSGRRESTLSRLLGTRRRLLPITPKAHVWFAPKNLKQAQINQDFGFICHCQICDGSVDSVSRSDHRCIEPHKLETAVGGGSLIMANPSRVL